MPRHSERGKTAPVLSEAPVRGSGQSPEEVCFKHCNWNSHSDSNWLSVKSCGVTTRKADESGTVPLGARRGDPSSRFLHNPTLRPRPPLAVPLFFSLASARRTPCAAPRESPAYPRL